MSYNGEQWFTILIHGLKRGARRVMIWGHFEKIVVTLVIEYNNVQYGSFEILVMQ